MDNNGCFKRSSAKALLPAAAAACSPDRQVRVDALVAQSELRRSDGDGCMGCALSDPFEISTTLNHRALIPIHFCRRWRGCSTSCGIRPTRAFRPGLHSAAAGAAGFRRARPAVRCEVAPVRRTGAVKLGRK